MSGREITKYAVIYGEYIRNFWPTLCICHPSRRMVSSQTCGAFARESLIVHHDLWNYDIHCDLYPCGICMTRAFTHSSSLGLSRTTYIHIYGVYAVFLAGKSPNLRSYTVYIYGSGQPYSSRIVSLLVTRLLSPLVLRDAHILTSQTSSRHVLSLTALHASSSHPRLNAFVIQTKLA
jgi:hypothetical protein